MDRKTNVVGALKRNMSGVLWPAVAFLLSMAASPVFGRSLWIDEILRVAVQRKYTIAQLLECRHLMDFDSQSPIGYILWRPIQHVMGMEFGGSVLSAAAAALFVWAILFVTKKVNGNHNLSWISCAIAATSPLIVYYGGELWFYMPWAAAFGVAVAGMLSWNEASSPAYSIRCAVLVALAACVFVALHFAGIFIWAVAAAVYCIVCWRMRGFGAAVRSGCVCILPVIVNLPLYLKAQFAAKHLDAAGANFDRLSTLPEFLWRYFIQIFPSLGAGWWVGVAFAVIGAIVLARRRNPVLALLIAVTFGWILYTSYVHLRGYPFVVARFWLFAMIGVMPLLLTGCEAVRRRYGFMVAVPVFFLICNIVGTVAVVQMEGRTLPALRFARELERIFGSCEMVFPNHYDIRPFSMYASAGKESSLLFPSYWEQGEGVRKAGLAELKRISPLTPIFLPSAEVDSTDWGQGRVIEERRTMLQKLAVKAHVFPEPNSMKADPAYCIRIPDETNLVAKAEKDCMPVFVPGREWKVRMMPPSAANKPFLPYLALSANSEGRLRVYIPKGYAAGSCNLQGIAGSDSAGTAHFDGCPVSLEKKFRSVKIPVRNFRKGEWVDISVKAGGSMVAFAMPSFGDHVR